METDVFISLQMINTEDEAEMRLQVRLDYRQFIDELNSKENSFGFIIWCWFECLDNRQLYISPENDELEKKIDQVDQAFSKGEDKWFGDFRTKIFFLVKMPREGVLDASTLRTISNLASVRIRAVDEAGSLDRAYEFARKCEKIISKLVGNANEFYELFANYHHVVPAPSMM